MARDKVGLNLPVNLGLDLANPVAGLPAGKLVRAQNKAPYVWGPRHGTTLIDRTSRGRGNMGFNGTSSYATIYYNETQLGWGKKWTWDCLIKMGAFAATFRTIWASETSAGPLWVWVHTDGSIRASLTDSSSSSVTLIGTTIFAEDDVIAIRVVRDGSTIKLYCNNTIEASYGSFSATLAMKDSTTDVLIGKDPSYAGTSNFFIGTIGAISIRNYVDEDFSYSYSELPYPRNLDVLGAWTGELVESDGYVYDASSYGNLMECTANISSATRITELIEPVHHIKNSTVLDGRTRNMVWVGGRLFSEIV